MNRTMLAALAVGALACSRHDPPDVTATADSTRLVSTEWQLVDLLQQPAPLGAGNKPVTLRLTSADARVSGFGGCNRYAGSYAVRGDSLRFGPVLMTRMACTQGNDLEVRYAAAIERVRRFRLADQHLELLAGDSVIARYTPIMVSR